MKSDFFLVFFFGIFSKILLEISQENLLRTSLGGSPGISPFFSSKNAIPGDFFLKNSGILSKIPLAFRNSEKKNAETIS